MHDTLGLGASGPAIALAGVNLALGRGASRVPILKDLDLPIGAEELRGSGIFHVSVFGVARHAHDLDVERLAVPR